MTDDALPTLRSPRSDRAGPPFALDLHRARRRAFSRRKRDAMTPIDDHGPDHVAVGNAIATLRTNPALATDARAHAAIDALASRLDPAQREKAHRLARAAHLVNSSRDLDDVLAQALRLAVEVMGAERGFLVVRDGSRAAAVACGGAETETPPPAASVLAATLETGEAIFSSDARNDPRWKTSDASPGTLVVSLACVPVRVRDEVLGAVYLDSRERSDLFSTSDREMLEAFGYQAALAIENARLFDDERERLERISSMQQFQTRILEAIANGVITLSPAREITTFNRAAETTFGVASETMHGAAANALAAMIPEFPELLETFFYSGGVHLRAEVEARRSDGTALTLEMRLSPLDNPDGKGVAIVVTDVTKQRRLEVAHEAQVEKAKKIEASFSRYLAPHIVKSLMNDPNSIRLGGERKRATMFFADIRGFTSLAARLPAERVVEILNMYFDEAVKIVFEHDGMLDKFYGDGLMAVFGTPRMREDDAGRAIAAAIRLHQVVGAMGPKLDYPLRISVGLATGDVVAGHVGSAQRMDYTVIGDAVNLANGLQSAAPAGAIYCDEATFAAAGTIELPTQRLDARIKGRADLVTAYGIFPGAFPLVHAGDSA